MKSSKKHIHKYIRAKLGTKEIYKCAIPGCSHYLFKPLIEGKFSLCWRCNEPFVMTKAQMKLKKPHCLNCTESTRTKKVDRLKQLIDADDLLKVLE